ncbi:MAG TPA: hypothetical protein DEG76_12130, partial [Pseudohongiella sp.]|nr:hypothetical protein [Pseudohongiella sp.]
MTQHSVFTRMRLAVPLAATLLLTACGNEEPPAPVEVRAPIQAISQIPLQDMVACAEDAAPLVNNTGTFSRSINTGMELAQAYFDQGLRLTYGYYFPEAIASFNAALCLDPNNAMVHWGRALAMGPNPNSRYAGVSDDPAGAGKAAIDRAMALADTLPPPERGLVETLAVLFDSETYPDVMARTNAFVEAAEANYQTHSDDLEAAFLVPHGIMMTTPWTYFSAEDGSALPGVARA